MSAQHIMIEEEFPKVYLYRRIVQSKLFIDRNFTKNIDTDVLSEEASFSKFHFLRLFKKIYGKTPHQYLTAVRIERAKILLSEEMSVTQVCFEVGFSSLSSFTGLFKRYVGRTPSAYQLWQGKRKAEMSSRPAKFVPHCYAERISYLNNSNSQEARG